MRSIDAPWEEEIIFLDEPTADEPCGQMHWMQCYFHGTAKKYCYGKNTKIYEYFKKMVIDGELFTAEYPMFNSLRYYHYEQGRYVTGRFPSFPAIILNFDVGLNDSYYFYWYEDNYYDDEQSCTAMHFFNGKNGKPAGDWLKYNEEDCKIISEIIDVFKQKVKCVQ
jgi:hypothetical protein